MLSRTGNLVLSLCLLSSVTACFTAEKERRINEDLYKIQARLMSLEDKTIGENSELKKGGELQSQRLASTSSDLDKVRVDIRKIQGELDTLRVGVKSGSLPGENGAEEDNSIASRLKKAEVRLESIETAQTELLATIKAIAGDNKKKKGLKNATDINTAFTGKRFKEVADEGPALIKGMKGKDLERSRLQISESLFRLSRFKDAALAYNDYLEHHKETKDSPLVKLRLGDCFTQLGEAETAKTYYEEVVRDHPNSQEATKAKERLAKDGESSPKSGKASASGPKKAAG